MLSWVKKNLSEEKKLLKFVENNANKIIMLEEEFSKLTDKELINVTTELKSLDYFSLGEKERIDFDIRALANFREATYRKIGFRHHKVQLMGAFIMNQGDIAEMRTGEGKTITAAACAYMNACKNISVHVITVNEYLVERDANEMGEIIEWLGISVAFNSSKFSQEEKQVAYSKDILYSTNSELGFDYLRDNMATSPDSLVQRGLDYVIIDEVDSVLIDEARTPLIISGQPKKKESYYLMADGFVKTLATEDYDIDEKQKTVLLSNDGITKAEEYFAIGNLFEHENSTLIQHINQALKAVLTLEFNVDYVVREGKIELIDQFTGRIMEGRSFSDGLHQAIEAKEGVEISEQTTTIATITYQNYFRLYNRLSGMTGTGKTEEEEFVEIYNMRIIEVPTNRPVQRIDKEDLIFATLKQKFDFVLEDIIKINAIGQPILVGTSSVESNEYLSKLLTDNNIEHSLLNAKNHGKEADIIAAAGKIGAITIATNMAGRGTDIKLGPGVEELGGLYVIGTERHESRRIDNQLRGRSGRQGNVGVSQFVVSLEDPLMVRFGTDKIKLAMQRFLNDTGPITNKMISKSIVSAQKRVESANFDSRKNVLKYDEVLKQQREIMYTQRRKILLLEDTEEFVIKAAHDESSRLVDLFYQNGLYQKEELYNYLKTHYTQIPAKKIDDTFSKQEIIENIIEYTLKKIELNKHQFGEEEWINIQRSISIQIIDKLWMEHIDSMTHLREGIYLRSYGQMDPLTAYQEEGYFLFKQVIHVQQELIIRNLVSLRG